MKPLNKINNEITKLETQMAQLQERLRHLKAQRSNANHNESEELSLLILLLYNGFPEL